MKFTTDLVDSYADKLLIGLTDEENKLVLDEFSIIDEEMELISQFEGIEEVEPLTHPIEDLEFIPREDVSKDGLTIDEILQNCDKYEGREIEVPKVVS